jgi:hypothetical protein
MKNRTLGTLVVWAAAHCCLSSAYADTKSGEARLQELTGQDVAKKALKVSLGAKVKADCTFYIIPENTSDMRMYYGYYVAFFDKDKNLIATSAFGGGKLAQLEPGKATNIGNLIELPSAQLQRIAFYQVALLEDAKEFGK